MKLLLFSLALFGLALIAQSGTVEKREVSEEEDVTIESDNSSCTCKDGECNRCDDNGCEQVSSCNGKREALEKRASGEAVLIKLFNSDTSNCKCLDHGYCVSKINRKDYSEVSGCGEKTLYTYCDSTGCRQVKNDDCFCEFGRCEKCDQSGCKTVEKCETATARLPDSDKCEKCNDNGCIEQYTLRPSIINAASEYVGFMPKEHYDARGGCEKECEEGASGDILLEEKCTYKDGVYQMCDKYQCKPVPNCDRFATCKCKKGSREDTYRRCYGFNHGKHHCRTLRTCSEQTRIEDERNKSLCRNCKKIIYNVKTCSVEGKYEAVCQEIVYDYIKALEDRQRV